MKELNCIIIGGGHAGIGALKSIKEATKGMTNGNRIRFVLIDKYPGHVRKVMLFRPAVDDGEIMVPWTQLFPDGVQFVQGRVTSVNKEDKQIKYTDAHGKNAQITYDLLVVTLGSIARQPDSDLGGITLTDPQTAVEIREKWRKNLQKAVSEKNPEERKRLMTTVVAGAGISGMETSAELVYAMRKEAVSLGLNPHDVSIYLLNAKERLFQEGPEKVGKKLEQLLNEYGVTVLPNCKAVGEEAGVIKLNNGKFISAGLLVWTIGLVPNPALRSMGLPLTPEGQVQVDECYRVIGTPGVYSIGDCAGIIDPKTGKPANMRCAESVMQAGRLGKIILADLEGRPAPVHKSLMELFCIGLGEDRGLVWNRTWGLDIFLKGKLAWRFKKMTWDHASHIK